ncbi:MAG TPA: hypothetical protein VL614_03265 [Acetobacteraceae bacterium]|nr:hypothetical protein [Acetobacteraceae bacterium]
MTLDLSDCSFAGPALPEPFVRFDLGEHLTKLGLLPGASVWGPFRQQLRFAGGGAQRICKQVVAPLALCLGFAPPVRQDDVVTREGAEDAGWLMRAPCGTGLRAWAFAPGSDLDAPPNAGRAYRFSPTRSASRVLRACEERLGLLTDGQELRLLLCDAVRSDSHIAIPIGATDGWRDCDTVPDSFRLVFALASPPGIAALPGLLDAARLSQSRLTKDLRTQARHAIEGFLQAVIDRAGTHHQLCADALWREGLKLVYRLLFILKLESAAEPGRGFSFASTSLWRVSLSPNRALGPLVRRMLDHGHDTGRMLEDGLRLLFRVFRDGLSTSELSIAPVGGALFDDETTPLLDSLAWGERACALLLDRLLWTRPKGGGRERVHYGSLDVEDLGHIYEALLDLEPGIAAAPMSRMRRAKLELVVPLGAGARCRASVGGDMRTEDIPAGRFYLRAGSGRKVSGSYYTPHPFVRFLVQETLQPKITRCSPDHDPQPGAILALKVLDPAVGSGHFLVEACRYLGDALYAACRRCDELAASAHAEGQSARAEALRQRVAILPVPNGMLPAYLPGQASEGGGDGVSQARALAICRRLVAVHCLYGVDSNPLAIELAKLSLWLESYGEGLPLTFLDHRLVQGNSVSGPFAASLENLPVSREPLEQAIADDLGRRVDVALCAARAEIGRLQESVGIDAVDVALKSAARSRLCTALHALRQLARAWSGAAMCATDDNGWITLARHVAATGQWPASLDEQQAKILAAGNLALPWDLTFPDVPDGFDAVISNPPWDIMQPNASEFLAAFDLAVLDANNSAGVRRIKHRLFSDPMAATAWQAYKETFTQQHRVVDRLYWHQRIGAHGGTMGGKLDLYRVFTERMLQLAAPDGAIGMIVPSAFHANEGASGIRQLYLQNASLEQCLSFENREKHFDIDGRFKFALVIARRPGPTRIMRCGFYLANLAEIADPSRVITYDRAFLAATGGVHSTFLELRHRDDMELVRRMLRGHQSFMGWSKATGVTLSRELHMTDDARIFTPISDLPRLALRHYLHLHEGKTIQQFSDRWDNRPRYAVAADLLARKPRTLDSTRYYRAASREVAGSTNERTAIAAMLPPGVLCGHTISVERSPAHRPNASALLLVGVMNSYCFDWLVRQKAAAHVSIYILAGLPMPKLAPDAERLLVHGALRLCCNHRGFARLWAEQLGSAWREPSSLRSWPVIGDLAARWALRAAMDAVVAHGYGLDRSQFERILDGFNHKSYPTAPALCVAAFDEVASQGQHAFCCSHDPYADIPLVTANALPVINPRATRNLPVRPTREYDHRQ